LVNIRCLTHHFTTICVKKITIFKWIFYTTTSLTNAGSATFAIGPIMCSDELLTRYNVLYGMFIQIGQLIGVALAGVLLKYTGNITALMVNGISFILCAVCVWIAPIIINKQSFDKSIKFKENFINDWKEIIKILHHNKQLLLLIILCTGDYLAINFINLALVPIVSTKYSGNTYLLSIFDGSFAIGSIIFAFIINLVSDKILRSDVLIGSIGFQSLLFVAIAILKSPILIVVSMLLFGGLNTISLTIFTTSIQKLSKGQVKGRISAVRQLMISITASIAIPLVSSFHEKSIFLGLTLSAIIYGLYSISVLILSKMNILSKCIVSENEMS